MFNSYQEWFDELLRVAVISGLSARSVQSMAPIAFTIYFDARLTPAQAFGQWMRECSAIIPTLPGILCGLERPKELHAPLGLPVTASELSEMCYRL